MKINVDRLALLGLTALFVCAPQIRGSNEATQPDVVYAKRLVLVDDNNLPVIELGELSPRNWGLRISPSTNAGYASLAVGEKGISLDLFDMAKQTGSSLTTDFDGRAELLMADEGGPPAVALGIGASSRRSLLINEADGSGYVLLKPAALKVADGGRFATMEVKDIGGKFVGMRWRDSEGVEDELGSKN